jgi:ABC-type transport system substrate-binding protein
MKRIGLRLLVASSLLLAGRPSAATRPHYGGTLRVAIQGAPTSLDPADPTQPEDRTRANLTRLIFDTLVTLDARGKSQPALATFWLAEPSNQRWQFSLRPGIRFHDGSPLTSDAAAASLRMANPNWKVLPLGDAVMIETDSPGPNLPAELALARNAIVKRDAKLLGTGPFAIADWQPGKKLTLSAQEGYWGGRPLLDSIEIEMGRNFREQLIALDLGRADVVEIAAEQAHRAAAEGRRVVDSTPAELLALVFMKDRQSPEDGRLRQALALSIDRQSIKNVLLQGQGEPAGGVLPNWMTGYAFLFPVNADPQRARQERSEVRQAVTWTIGYDGNDPLARLVAERVVLTARDAGITLQVTVANTAEVRLVRIPLAALDARLALMRAAAALGLPEPKLTGHSAEDLYSAESALLQSQRVIPLLHLPVSYGLGGAVRNWHQDALGTWRLEDAWVSSDKP